MEIVVVASEVEKEGIIDRCVWAWCQKVTKKTSHVKSFSG